MRIHVLRNPSGGGKASRRRAAEAVGRLRGAGHDVVELTGDSAAESGDALASAVRNGDVERVLIAGGDGLVHLAIQHLAQTSIPVAIAPTGTGNDFATALGLHNTHLPIEQTIDAPARPVDLMLLTSTSGQKWVASVAIAGFPAAINERANAMSLPIAAPIYAISAVLELPRFVRRKLALSVDGEALEIDTAMLAIGNTSLFGGGMLACPDATPTDGLLHVTSIEGVGRLGVIPHLIGRAGGTDDRPEVLKRTATQIQIHTLGTTLWGDGEPLMSTPISIDLVPAAINIVGAPPN